MSFKIIGTGSAMPKQVITNDDLTKILDTSDEWIRTRVGITERRIINTENEPRGLLTLAVTSGRNALENSGLEPSEIDMVICPTLQGEYITPAMSCLVAKELGIECNFVFDINMGCCGYIFALDLADTYIRSGKVKNVLIVCAEALSRTVDWTDRSMCVLFGDGSAASVITKADNFTDIRLTTDGQVENLYMPHINSNCPYSSNNDNKTVMQMNGQEIYKFAVKSICSEITSIMERNNISSNDVKYFLLHQANQRIIASAMNKLGQTEEKCPTNIERYGNTSCVTIPLLLDEINRARMLCDGDLLVLNAFGAGLSTGVCILKW